MAGGLCILFPSSQAAEPPKSKQPAHSGGAGLDIGNKESLVLGRERQQEKGHGTPSPPTLPSTPSSLNLNQRRPA